MGIIIIHDIVNPKSGLTYKEENLLITHNIPLGTKVKYIETIDYDKSGEPIEEERILYVLYHDRDCDGTPLYVIGELGNKVWQDGYENKFYLRENINGVNGDDLEVLV